MVGARSIVSVTGFPSSDVELPKIADDSTSMTTAPPSPPVTPLIARAEVLLAGVKVNVTVLAA